MQGLAQHCQNALAQPNLPQLVQHLHLGIKHLVFRGQASQLAQGQAHTGQRQCRPHQPRVLRVRHGPQPVHQVSGFVALVNRVFVGQVHRNHAPLLQRAAQGGRLFAGAHQQGNVAGSQALQWLTVLGETIVGVIQPAHNLLGTALGERLAHRPHALQFQVMHQGDGGERTLPVDPLFFAPFGGHGHKRQRIVSRLSALCFESKSPFGLVGFGLQKGTVHGLHQGLGRAVIDRQRIVPPLCGLARIQVTVNIGPAKTINGLFGVANQQQSPLGRVVRRAVNLVKNPVLNRRGVLKLINQGHRVLRRNALAQGFALGAMQRGIQPFQQIRKPKLALLAFELAQASRDTERRMKPCRRAGLGQFLQIRWQISKGLKRLCLGGTHDNGLAVFAGPSQTLGGQAGPSRLRQIGHQGGAFINRPFGPGLQFVQPIRDVFDGKLAAIPAVVFGRVLRQHKAAHERHARPPLRPQVLQCGLQLTLRF